MNRYDYYTRCACVDEQEWLIDELYYPDGDEPYGHPADFYDWDCDDRDDFRYEEFEEEDDWKEDDWDEEGWEE